MSKFRFLAHLAVAGLLFAAALPALAMGTAFTYQGSLEDGGVPANGNYDFQFTLIDSVGGTLGTNLRDNVSVVQGVFTVELNYGSPATAFPGPFVRFLQIGIRPAGSDGAYEFLTPLTPINPAPYAQRAALVSNGAITGESIAAAAVTESKLANTAVGTAKLADVAVTNAKLADNAVNTVKLANGAVTNAKVAAGTLTMSRHAGVFFNGTIGSLGVSPGGCVNFNVPVGGGALAGDFPLVALQAGETLPGSMTLSATRVPVNGQMELRACNAGNSTASWTTLNLIFMTLR